MSPHPRTLMGSLTALIFGMIPTKFVAGKKFSNGPITLQLLKYAGTKSCHGKKGYMTIPTLLISSSLHGDHENSPPDPQLPSIECSGPWRGRRTRCRRSGDGQRERNRGLPSRLAEQTMACQGSRQLGGSHVPIPIKGEARLVYGVKRRN